MPAFDLARSMRADGVELDIQLSKDGEIMVCHDEKLDRTSSGTGWLKDYTLSELKSMDFSNGMEEYKGVTIPTMGEVFDLLKDTGMTVNIELKTGLFHYPGIERKIVEMVREKGFEGKVIYTSFNHLSLEKIRLLDKDAKLGFLYMNGTNLRALLADKLKANAINVPFHSLLHPGLLDECRENGLEVNVWTVDDPAQLKICEKCGVYAVITNVPDKAARLFEKGVSDQ